MPSRCKDWTVRHSLAVPPAGKDFSAILATGRMLRDPARSLIAGAEAVSNRVVGLRVRDVSQCFLLSIHGEIEPEDRASAAWRRSCAGKAPPDGTEFGAGETKGITSGDRRVFRRAVSVRGKTAKGTINAARAGSGAGRVNPTAEWSKEPRISGARGGG